MTSLIARSHGPMHSAVDARFVSAAATDAEVMADVAAGDGDALAELYDRFGTVALSIAYRITRDAALAEDVVQEAFLGAWRNAGRYVEGRGSVKTWLLAVVHHRAIDVIRRRRATTDLPAWDHGLPAALITPDIWPEVAATLDAATVRAALDRLSIAQRTALELAYFDGLTQREIAERTGTPLGTVKSRMRLGLLTLRRFHEAIGTGEAAVAAVAVDGDSDASSAPCNAAGPLAHDR